MRKDAAFIWTIVIITFLGLLLTSDYYVSRWSSPPYKPPETFYFFVIIPAFIIFVMSLIIGYYAHRALKVAGPREIRSVIALYDFMTLWALIAFETFLGWLYFYITKDSLCVVNLFGLKIRVWFIAHAWYFPILGGIAYSILLVSFGVGRKYSKTLCTIELILFVLVSILIFLPWNYWGSSPPAKGLFTRPIVYGVSLIAGLLACIPGIKYTRNRLKEKISKIDRVRLKILMLGFISIIVFWIFLFLYSVALAMYENIIAHYFLGVAGVGAGLSPILLYLGLLPPKWLIKRISE